MCPSRISIASDAESEHAPLSFANEGQFLLVSAASFDAVREAHARVLRSEPNPTDFDDDGTRIFQSWPMHSLHVAVSVSTFSVLLDDLKRRI